LIVENIILFSISWTLCESSWSPKRLISAQFIYLTIFQIFNFLFPDDQTPQLEIQRHYRLQANCICIKTIELGKRNPIKAPSLLKQFSNHVFLLNVYLKIFPFLGELNELMCIEQYPRIYLFIYLISIFMNRYQHIYVILKRHFT
jgi:hypothetical protein